MDAGGLRRWCAEQFQTLPADTVVYGGYTLEHVLGTTLSLDSGLPPHARAALAKVKEETTWKGKAGAYAEFLLRKNRSGTYTTYGTHLESHLIAHGHGLCIRTYKKESGESRGFLEIVETGNPASPKAHLLFVRGIHYDLLVLDPAGA